MTASISKTSSQKATEDVYDKGMYCTFIADTYLVRSNKTTIGNLKAYAYTENLL